MMLLAALLGTLSALLLLAAGYLFGVGRGAVARKRLSEQSLGQIEDLRRERQVLAEQRDDKRSSLLRKDLAELLDQLLHQSNALQGMLLPLSRGIGEADNLRATIEQVLSPLMQRERLESALSSVVAGGNRQSDLTRLLNEVAAIGGFRAVVLSDDQGLPLAHSDNAWDLDRIAGTSSFLLVLAERIARDGAPAPLSLMVHDEENTVILCRAFRVRDARLLLTAVAAGAELTPTALDPTLSRVEKILST
jgi:predicted regulator of Ras-like GTPase activity (Roadblock/LC7/MglB family)